MTRVYCRTPGFAGLYISPMGVGSHLFADDHSDPRSDCERNVSLYDEDGTHLLDIYREEACDV